MIARAFRSGPVVASFILILTVATVPDLRAGIDAVSNKPAPDPCEGQPESKCCPKPTGSGGCGAATCAAGDSPGGAGDGQTMNGCAWITMGTGGMRPGVSLEPGFLQLLVETPSPTIFTPSALRYVLGYGIHSMTMSGSGTTPADVFVQDQKGLTTAFRFAAGSSIAKPYSAPQESMPARLLMVDAQGWSVTNDPAYFDLYPGYGEVFRFVASTNSPDYLQLVLHKTQVGREEDADDIDVEVIKDNDGILRQIYAPAGLADIVVSTGVKYCVSFYKRADVLSAKDGNGYYVVGTNAFPLRAITIENSTPGNIDNLRVSRATGSYTSVYDYVYNPAIEGWDLTKGGGLSIDKKERVWNDAHDTRLTTKTTSDSNGKLSSKETFTHKLLNSGYRLTEKVVDPDSAALKTKYTYYENALELGRYAKIKTVERPEGGWTTYDYNESGYKTVEVNAWKDSPFDSSADLASATYYDYSAVATDDSTLYNDQRPRTVTEKVLGQTVKKTFYAFLTNAVGEVRAVEERCVTPAAAYGDSSNLRKVTTYYGTNTANRQIGRVKSIELPNGLLDTYTYEHGNYHPSNDVPADSWFEVDVDGDAWCITIAHGTTNSPAGIANKSTKDTEIWDGLNRKVLTESYVFTGGSNYERISWMGREYDDLNRLLSVAKSDGTIQEQSWGANCCGVESSVSVSGIETTYTYDLMKRMISLTKKGTNSPTDDLAISYTYNASGQRLTQYRSGGSLNLLISSNVYDLAGRSISSMDSRDLETSYSYADGDKISTTVHPGGLTNVSVSYLSRQTKSRTENGSAESTYDYGVNTDGSTWSKVFTGPDGTNSVMWSTSTVDMLGRTIRSEKPGFGNSIVTNEYLYDGDGALVKTTSHGMADTLYEDNELSQRIRSGLDVDGDGALDLGENDRITESDVYYEKDGSDDWWLIGLSKLYSVSGSDTIITNRISKSRLTGLSIDKTDESVSIDIRGNQTVYATAIDRGNKSITRTINHPDSTNDAVSVSVNGLLASSTTKHGLETTYGYDALGRRIGTTDPRTGMSVTHYNNKGEVGYVEDAAGNRTSYGYSADTGRRTTVTNALGKIARHQYSVEGQLLRTWGDTTYPVSYVYGDYGRMIDMKTYRNGSGWSGAAWPASPGDADTTQWKYDAATGLLTNKVYADGNGTSYSYTPDGRLETRTWARGVTTTYSYTNTTGEMIEIDYSDSTPDVFFAYNRQGQQEAITDAQGIRTFNYNPATLELTNETIVAGGVTNVIGRFAGYSGRPASLNLTVAGVADPGYRVSYNYSSIGRFSQVTATSVLSAITNVFNYSYVDDSSLVESLAETTSGFSISKTYEADRNLITDIENKVNATTISRYAYSNDELGRRVAVTNTGLAFTDPQAIIDYLYNTRSEVTNATIGGRSFGYQFDNIGNRQSHVTNGVEATYLANELNQYTNITKSTSITPVYDADGNMTQKGIWTFAWNGENRMIQASNGTTVVSMLYDYMGRRVLKVSGTTTNTFTYDGWNMICEIVAGGADPGTTNFYVWGLDLSGSQQGAGGIGGLLSWAQSGDSKPCLYAFDANGNVGQLVDAVDGTIDAHYEYSPFGCLINSSGPEANNNHYRFSAKYLDDETELCYYGYRYYDPITGRWPSRDPIQEWGGPNIYNFWRNDPITFVDVDGRGGYPLAIDDEGHGGAPAHGNAPVARGNLAAGNCPEDMANVLRNVLPQFTVACNCGKKIVCTNREKCTPIDILGAEGKVIATSYIWMYHDTMCGACE